MSEELKTNLAIGGLLAMVFVPVALAGGYWLATGKSALTLLGW